MSRIATRPAIDWAGGPTQPLAPRGELHVWHAELDQRPERSAAFALLCTDDERARAADMPDPLRRARFVARRALHRLLIGGYATGNGRMELQTSVGHLGGDALFAFGRTVGLGASIVAIPGARALLARRSGLTNRERLELGRRAPGGRAWLAGSVLAAKEAIGKACGRGLDATIEAQELLGTVEPVARGGPFAIEIDGLPWAGNVLRLRDDRVACVAHRGAALGLRCWTFGR